MSIIQNAVAWARRRATGVCGSRPTEESVAAENENKEENRK